MYREELAQPSCVFSNTWLSHPRAVPNTDRTAIFFIWSSIVPAWSSLYPICSCIYVINLQPLLQYSPYGYWSCPNSSSHFGMILCNGPSDSRSLRTGPEKTTFSPNPLLLMLPVCFDQRNSWCWRSSRWSCWPCPPHRLAHSPDIIVGGLRTTYESERVRHCGLPDMLATGDWRLYSFQVHWSTAASAIQCTGWHSLPHSQSSLSWIRSPVHYWTGSPSVNTFDFLLI